MGMPEATKDQLENEVIHTLHKHGVESGCVLLTEDIMETVVKAWYFGRDTGYREARDDISKWCVLQLRKDEARDEKN